MARGSVVRLFLLGVGLVVGVGCFDVETKVTLQASGKGTYSSHVGLYPPFGAGVPMPAAPDKKQIKALKKAGLKKLTYAEFSDDQRGRGFDLALKFNRVSSLAALEEVKMPADVHLDDLGGGRYALWTKGSDKLAKPPTPAPEGDARNMADMLSALTGGMAGLDNINKLKVSVSLEVPGRIEKIEPAWGAVVDNAVTWTLDSQRLMGGAKADGKFVVEFTPKKAFPAKVVDSQGKGVAPL